MLIFRDLVGFVGIAVESCEVFSLPVGFKLCLFVLITDDNLTHLTTDDVGDPTALPDLLDQISGPVDKFIADGAYDGAPSRDLLETRLGNNAEVIIPPPKTAVLSLQSPLNPSVRDRHLVQIETCGRLAWQKSTGYNQRSRGETLMGRWKTVIGPKLKARNFDNQKTEARIGVRVLNRMTELGRQEFRHIS
ncbi:transposase [Brucella pituitosa]|uniref:transposase n=1 Tax=Brucella pituitosa TaxID=571256 RepID=UPI001FE6C4BB|nr:transposase [Brucella pituitosa]